MATIVFVVDSEMGHLYSSAGLARELVGRGHRVCYLGSPEAEKIIARQGFEFHVLSLATRSPSEFENESSPFSEKDLYLLQLINGALLDDIFSRLQPAAALISSMHLLEALAIKYRYRIPTALYTSSLPTLKRRERTHRRAAGRLLSLDSLAYELLQLITKSGIRLKAIDDVSKLALQMPEFVFLPAEWDLPGEDLEANLYHLGPNVDLDRRDGQFDWTAFDSRPICYCSLGSQTYRKPDISWRFFRSVINAFEEMPDWQLILSTGPGMNPGELEPVPSNACVKETVPQMEVLSRARVMLTHAGIGSVRECVLMRVPMLFFPLMRDQFECAARMSHLGLGVVGDLASVRHTDVMQLVRQVAGDASVKANIERMRKRFIESQNVSVAVGVIEQAMGTSAVSASGA